MHCEMVPIVGCEPDAEGRIYTRCLHCGMVLGPHFPVETQQPAECLSENQDRIPLPLPNLAIRFNGYIKAWIRHRANGRPLVPFETILERFRVCSACEFYNDAEGACAICGCIVNLLQGGKIAPNKLEWGDEKCPRNPPLWDAVAKNERD